MTDTIDLRRGDSLAILADLASDSFDALITDPPYASGGAHAADRQRAPSDKYQQGGHRDLYAEFFGEGRDQRSHLRWTTIWLTECYRLLKEGAPVCLFTDWRQLPITTDALQMAGFTWRGIAVWDKDSSCRPQLGRFRQQAEYIVWGSKGGMPRDRAAGARVLPGVFQQAIRRADKLHMTGKPTPLMREIVKICAPGGRILDPFAGSGTTLVAAALEGYQATGMELSDHYYDIAHRRLEQLEADPVPA